MPGYVTSVIEVLKIVKGTENIDKDFLKYISVQSPIFAVIRLNKMKRESD